MIVVVLEPMGYWPFDPAPMMLIPMPEGTTMPVVQVQVPAGMLIVSPSTAVCVGPLMTAFTSVRLQVAAVNVPCALADDAIKHNIARTRNFFILPPAPLRLGTQRQHCSRRIRRPAPFHSRFYRK